MRVTTTWSSLLFIHAALILVLLNQVIVSIRCHMSSLRAQAHPSSQLSGQPPIRQL